MSAAALMVLPHTAYPQDSRHVTTDHRRITPSDAAVILARDIFKSQRNRGVNHVSYLAETMRRAEFDASAPLRFAEVNGQAYLIDGQHRLAAVVVSGIAQDFVVITNQCANMDEVSQLYARIDRGRTRSIGDALRALGVGTDKPLTASQLGLVMSCAPVMAHGLRNGRPVGGATYAGKSAEARTAVMGPYLDAAIVYFGLIAGTNRRLFERAEVMTLGLITVAEQPDKAVPFWSGAALDDGLNSADPRKQLIDYLRDPLGKGRKDGPGYWAQGVEGSWNAWYRGRTFKRFHRLSPGEPVRLLGTSWQGPKT